jgi:hypothetical protein
VCFSLLGCAGRCGSPMLFSFLRISCFAFLYALRCGEELPVDFNKPTCTYTLLFVDLTFFLLVCVKSFLSFPLFSFSACSCVCVCVCPGVVVCINVS